MYRIWLVLVASDKKKKTHKENQSQRLRTNYTNCACLWFETTSILMMSLYKSWVNQVQAFKIWDWTHQLVPQLTLTHSTKLTSLMLWWHPKLYIYSCLKLGLNICSFSPMQKFNGTSLLLTTIFVPPKPINFVVSETSLWATVDAPGVSPTRCGKVRLKNSTVFSPKWWVILDFSHKL